MSKKRKLNKFKVAAVIFLIVLFLMSITGFGRFVYNSIRDRYLASKKFYFKSDLLSVNPENYTYNNWDGYGIYKIELDLYSKENNMVYFEENLDYTLKVDFPNELNCSIESESGKKVDFVTNSETNTSLSSTIKSKTITGTAENEDKITIYVKVRDDETELAKNSKHTISVTAYTTEPYTKTISANFELEISDVAFDIIDKEYRNYAILNIRNIYETDAYISVKLNKSTTTNNIDLFFDMNEEVIRDILNDGADETTMKIRGQSDETGKLNDSVQEIIFRIPKESSKNIKLYKRYITNNFSQKYEIFTITRKEIASNNGS